MSKLILYIAISLDAFIAPLDGSVTWLEDFSNPEDDYGYRKFYNGIGTLIMGANTYDQILSFGEWPYAPKLSYVLSSSERPTPDNAEVRFFAGEVQNLLSWLKGRSDQDIWLLGGGDVNSQFIGQGLVDEYIISIMPVFLGSGIPLIRDIPGQSLKLLSTTTYPNGVVQQHYTTRPAPDPSL